MEFDMYNPPDTFRLCGAPYKIAIFVPKEEMIVALNKPVTMTLSGWYGESEGNTITFPRGFRFRVKNFYCYLALKSMTTSLVPVDVLETVDPRLEHIAKEHPDEFFPKNMFSIQPENFEPVSPIF